MKTPCNHSYFFILILFLLPYITAAQEESFYGPFPSWTNLKTVYGARGDGITDETRILQKALDELGEPGHSPVLFIPDGIYRITSTLTMKTKKGIAIYGEDPEKTIIRWDGVTGGKMFLLNGVTYSEYGRIQWDGNNKASVAYAHEWDGKVKFANSGSQHADEIFKNLQVGIKSGANMDAEMSIRRCRFYQCSVTAISLQGFNALDWWIWDCYFEKCNVGVANNLPAFGAGNFHVYRSVFNQSMNSDISLGNSNYFSFRNNISFHSGSFLKASQFSNTSPITIQGNLIISNADRVMMDLFTKGNVLLLDNVLVTPDSAKNFVIRNVNNYKNSTPDITLIGNKFTAKNKLVAYGGGRVLEEETVTGMMIKKLPEIAPVSFARVENYPVYEADALMPAEKIQALINKVASGKRKSVIHFKYGNYNLTQSLVIPPGAPVVLMGDGLQSQLLYKKSVDTLNDALIKIEAPANCVIKSLSIQGNAQTDGLLVYDQDKTGNTVYSNQLMLFNGQKTNVWVNGFSNTSFRMENFQHNYAYKGTSVKVEGKAGETKTIFRILGGESGVNDNSYAVSNNGKILVYDTWYEGNSRQFVSLKGEGEFYLNGAKIAVSGNTLEPFIKVDSFSGKVLIAEAIYSAGKKKILFRNNLNTAKFLSLGTLSWTDSTNNFIQVNDNRNAFAAVNNRFNVGKGSFVLPQLGDSSRTFIMEMLSVIRNHTVLPDKQPGKRSSSLVLDRVLIDGSKNNFRIEKVPAAN